MGQKELQKAAEELEPLGDIVLHAVVVPLYFVMVILLYIIALLMFTFRPLHFAPKSDFGPNSDEIDKRP